MPEMTFAARSTAVCHCRFATTAPAHHDHLLHAGTDVANALDLVELALTWHELDYSREPVIPPPDWPEFVAGHAWDDRDVAERLFRAALDIAHARAGSAARWKGADHA